MSRRAALVVVLAASACQAGGEGGPPVCERGCPAGAIARARVSYGGGETRFQAVALDPFGELVVAGDFRGFLQLGPLVEAGSDGNVSIATFAARVPFDGEPHGRIAPAGSSLGGIAPDFDGNVLVVTSSREPVPGSVVATLGTYADELGLGELYTTGDRAVIAAAADRHGRAIVAISAPDLAVRPFPPMLPGPHAVVVRVEQGARLTRLLAWPDAVIHDLVIGPAGEIVVAGDYSGEPATRFAGCAGRCGFVARLSPDGGIGWVRSIEDTAPASMSAIAIGLGGQVIALGAGDDAGFLLRLAPLTGEIFERTSLVEGATAIDSQELAVGPDGTVYVALAYRGTAVIGGRGHPGPATDDRFDTVLGAVAPDGSLRWARVFAGDGTIAARDLIVARGFPVLVGEYQGSFPGQDLDVELPPMTPVTTTREGFLLVLAP